MLMDQDESVDVLDVVKNAIAYVREHVSSSRITFGMDVLRMSKRMYNPQQPEEVPNAIPESPKPQEHPRILMVAGQEYEVRVVNGKRLIVPTSSPVTRKPIRRTPGEDQVKREQMGAKQSEIDGLLTQKIVVDKKPQQRRERERGDKEYPAKRLRVNQIRSRSIQSRAYSFYSSATFANILIAGVVSLLDKL